MSDDMMDKWKEKKQAEIRKAIGQNPLLLEAWRQMPFIDNSAIFSVEGMNYIATYEGDERTKETSVYIARLEDILTITLPFSKVSMVFSKPKE